MKHKYLIALLLLCSINIIAQPQGINYQGVARDSVGHPVISQNISLPHSIFDGSATGSAVYVEIQNTLTTALLSLSII